jgi:hypothetical protein
MQKENRINQCSFRSTTIESKMPKSYSSGILKNEISENEKNNFK